MNKIVVELYGGPRDGDHVELFEAMDPLIVPVIRAADIVGNDDDWAPIDFDRLVETAIYHPTGSGARYLHDGMRIP